MPNNLNLEKHPKVTCLCPTSGRFSALRESISFFLLQDYPNKELLIFNNNAVSLTPHPKLVAQGVRVINAGDYSNRDLPTIYKDAMEHVSQDSKYVAVWDDDDIYLPWHLSTYIERLESSNLKAARCKWGMYRHHGLSKFTLETPPVMWTPSMNNFEASMVAESELMVFERDLDDDPIGIHPHITWNKRIGWDGFIHIDNLTCAFRYHTNWSYPHTQTGCRVSVGETGEAKVLRPAPVSHAFYEIVTNMTSFPVDKDVFTTKPFSDEIATEKHKAILLEKFASYDIKKFDHVDDYRVWFYWETPKGGHMIGDKIPPFIELCHETARRHTYCQIVVLTDEVLRKEYLEPYQLSVHGRWDTFTLIEKSEFLRTFMLHHFGGFWMDSDVLSVGDLDEYYYKYINYSKNVFPWENDTPGNLISCCFGCQAEQFFITTSLGEINKMFDNDPKHGVDYHPWAAMNLSGICKVLKKEYPLRNKWEIRGADEGVADLRYNHGAPCIDIPEKTLESLGGAEKVWKFTPEGFHENLCMFVLHWSQIGILFMDDSKDLMKDYGDASKIFDYALNMKSPHYVQQTPIKEIPLPVIPPHCPELTTIQRSKENFTLECNLSNGGWSEIWKNCRSQQHPGTYFALYDFYKRNNFECIIEIGTGEGGLTEFLCNMLPNTHIISLDLYPRYDDKIGKKYDNLRLLKGDCFASEIIEKLKRETTNKKTCWMLDGGNKNKEFNTFIKIAEKADFLMMHDFARNAQKHKEIYIEKKRWYWHESGFENSLNLEQAEWAGEEDLEQCLWGTYKKL
jgi:hypothetical protein